MTQQISHQPAAWIERLARFGYASKGVVYFIVGLLALQGAFGRGGETTDTEGALQALVRQPFGQILLALVAIGLMGYVIWRFVEAINDPENKGHDFKGIAIRLTYVANGLAYAGLAWTAVQIIMGSSSSDNSDSKQDWTARLLSQPFGQWLVGTIGAGVIAFGFYYLYKAFSAKFQRKLYLSDLTSTERQWIILICRFGLAARSIVFFLIGWFVIEAAYMAQASQVGGLGEALETLANQPYGPWLLTIVALGLVAYGVYMVVQARYRHLDPNM
ncbi:MAG: DUF1206 domain-containing protein [Richelia sp. RM2_1_2]|nr:DUF1206 domain-containing protein [Richelia sp. SM2_1_7]NJM20792.1 DUF1206 domain-containing protein [Richelia sp. SM1_7_0]NJN08941.1 DUF1206 domain-containing protein [Richelia sp. RM1_1_1]NJO28533.1 DUF1206 domain-containing protein [Richelia sp. SL_2_1]NJO57945.1 DUF1206 domain-containing protein [Richelia sp. RM2_1_2]